MMIHPCLASFFRSFTLDVPSRTGDWGSPGPRSHRSAARPRRKSLRIAPLVLSSLLLPAVLAAAGRPYSVVDQRDIYDRYYKTSCGEIGPDSFDLIVTNTSSRDRPNPYVALYIESSFATEIGVQPNVQFVEGTFRIVENGQFIDAVAIRGSTWPAYMDEELLRPATRDAGLFRNANLHDFRLKVCSGPRMIREVTGRQSLVTERAVFRVTVRKPGAANRPSPVMRQDPWVQPVLALLAVNAGMIPSFASSSGPMQFGAQNAEAWAARLAADAGRMPLLRLRCAEPGIYKVLPDDFQARGIDPATVDPESLRLLEQNTEIPLLVVSDPAGAQAWKALLFYSAGADLVRTPHRAYWLVSEPGGPTPPLRIDTRPSTSSIAGLPSGPTEGNRRKSYFEFRNYSHIMPNGAAHGRWSWLSVPQEEFREVEIEVPGSEAVSGNATLTAEIATTWNGDERPVALYWNHERVLRATVKASQVSTLQCEIPSDSIRPGRNVLGVEFPEKLIGRLPDTVELTNVTLMWTSLLVSADNAAPYEVRGSSDEGPVGIQFEVPDDEADGIFCIDIESGRAHSRLPFRPSVGDRAGSLVATDSVSNSREYWLARLSTARSPWRLERRDPPKLARHDLGADYVAVTIADLLPPTRRLLDLHAKEGMRSVAVDVEEVYDAFDYGVKSSRAIADFLRYAYYSWEEPPPYFVCLIGETSDFLADALGVPSDVQPDLVPNYAWGNPDSRARGDYPYGYVTPNDFVGDLSVGRISVATAGQLAKVVDKIEAYQNSPRQGAWRARHLFFTDDEREFQDIADLVIADANSSLSLPQRLFLNEYPYEPYFRYVERRRSEEATADLLRRLNEGVATSVYLGHGGPNVMSSERLFYLQDIPTLRRGSPPTFLGSASCDTAWLDYPKAPFEVSIGEMMVRLPDRGAIGMFGPVSGASSGMHKFLFQYWYHGVVGDRLRRTGDIALYALNSYYVNRNNTFVPDQYVLIGDPAVSLPEPRGRGLDIQVSTPNLLKGVAQIVHVTGKTETVQYGWVDISLRNNYGDPVVPDQRIRLVDGSFDVALDIEGQPEPGHLVLRADAMNEAAGAWEMGFTPIEVIDPELTVDLTTDPPPSTRFQPGQFSRLVQTVTNETEHTLTDIHIRLMAFGKNEPLDETVVDLAPHQIWKQSTGGRTPPGITRMELVAGRPGTGDLTPLGRSELTVFAPSPTRAAALAMPEAGLNAFPRPDGQGTEFQVQLENLATREARNLTVQLWEFSPTGDVTTTITEQLQVAVIPPGEGTTLRLLSPRIFPPYSGTPVLVMVKNDPEVEPTVEFPATVIFERNALIVPHVNVRVVPDSVTLSPQQVTRDETIFISAEIENIGREPVHNVLVEAFLDAPWDRKNWIRPRPHNYDVRIRELPPYQKARVRVRFDTPPRVNGGRRLYIVANSRKQFTEDTFDDNVGYAVFYGILLPNLALTPTDSPTSPVLVRPGEPQEISFVVKNMDGRMPSEATEVAIDASSPDRDWTAAAPSIPLRSIGPGRSAAASIRWVPTGKETQIRVMVSPERAYLEPVQEDNRAMFPVLTQLDSQFTPAGAAGETGAAWSQRSIFSVTVFHQAELQPTDRIAYRTPRVEDQTGIRFDNPTSGSGVVMLEPTEPVIDEKEWSFARGTFVALPESHPPPISFRLQRTLPDIETYDFYFQVPMSTSPRYGRPNGSVQVRIGDEKKARLLDPSGRPGWWCYAGRHRIPPSGIDVTFSKPEEPGFSGAQGYFLFPAVGRLTSPAIRFDQGAPPFRARLEGLTPSETRIELFGRWGHIEGNEMKWVEWEFLGRLPAEADTQSPLVEPTDDYFQWQARLYPTIDRSPELSDVVLIRE